jgi:hypothetical protein
MANSKCKDEIRGSIRLRCSQSAVSNSAQDDGWLLVGLKRTGNGNSNDNGHDNSNDSDNDNSNGSDNDNRNSNDNDHRKYRDPSLRSRMTT